MTLPLLVCLLASAAPALPVVSTTWEPSGVQGVSFQYRPGLFAAVLRHRGMPRLAGIDGFASVPDCRYVDVRHPYRVAVRWADGRTELLQVVDCSQHRDRAAQRRKGLVLEVDHASAVRGGWATYGGHTGPGHAPVTILGFWH